MKDLIEALNIFLKYGNPKWPTNCEHDTLWVNIEPELVSDEDKTRLDELGFFPDNGGFTSFHFGNC